MGLMPQDLAEYLRTMISPEERTRTTTEGGECVYLHVDDPDTYPWADHADESVHGLTVEAQTAAGQSVWLPEALRILKPGAHLMLAAPDDEPVGDTGACLAEDLGFEVRDCILWVDQPGDGDHLHYVAKAARAEREAGCAGLPLRTTSVEGEDGEDTEVEDTEPTKVASVRNFHPCLHPDALVMTDLGYRPISEMTVGAQVYAADGRFHTVEHVSHHPYTSADLFEISVMGTNYTTSASDNHPFLIWRPERNRNAVVGGQVLWVRADQVQKGDYTMTPYLSEPETSAEYDLNWWFVFGLWVAEGIVQRAGHGKSTYPSFTLHADEVDLIERIRSAFPSVNTGVYPKPGSKAVQVVSFDREAGHRFVEMAGRGSSTKCLHPSVWSLPFDVRRAIVEGYLAGDGGKVRTYLQAKTVSPDVASQMRLLASSVGYRTNLFTYAPTEGKGIGSRKFKSVRRYYQIQLFSDNTKNTAEGTRKASRPDNVEYEGVRFSLSYVKRVTRIPYTGDVWNLSVEGDPTFQTAVGMSHNTVKPVNVMVRLLADVPTDQGPVLEPFMGSGTTLLACIDTGHNAIGIEKDPDYFPIADARVRHRDAANSAWDAAVIESDRPTTTEAIQTTLEDLLGL